MNALNPDPWRVSRNVLSLTLLLCIGFVSPASAQLPSRISDSTAVSIITVMPGNPVYTMFGHSAIRFANPESGLDASFNYGTFDFDNTFPFRFASGKLDYRLDVTPTEPAFRHYRGEGRTIVEQHLTITPQQATRLYELLLVNYRPENRYYRYDFFFDNCSTRIRDILEEATSVTIGDQGRVSEETLRDLLTPYIHDRPALAALMNSGLGVGADQLATVRDRAFLPVELMHQLEASGLVATVDTLYAAGPRPGNRVPGAALGLWAVALLLGVVTILRARKRQARLRWIDVVLFGVVGLAGAVLTYLWFGSEHVVARKNLNLIWALPTHALIVFAVAKRHLPTWTRIYFAITLLLAFVLFCGLSWWTQGIHALALPIATMIAFRAGRCLLSATTNRPA